MCIRDRVELPEPPGEKGRGYFGQVDRHGRIWVAQDHFFGFWAGDHWVSSALAETVTNGFVAADQVRDGSLVVLSGQTLLRIEEDRVTSRIAVSETIQQVWQMDEDRQGQIWISTMDNG